MKEVKSKKTLKTFNLDEESYSKFSKHCKSQGLSMSKKIENFIKQELDNLSSNQPHSKNTSEDNLNKEHSFRKYC